MQTYRKLRTNCETWRHLKLGYRSGIENIPHFRIRDNVNRYPDRAVPAMRRNFSELSYFDPSTALFLLTT